MARSLFCLAVCLSLSATTQAAPNEDASVSTTTASVTTTASLTTPIRSADEDAVVALSRARVDAEHAHLGRLAIWAGTNVVAGGALVWLSTPGLSPLPSEQVPEVLRGFAVQSLAWGGINLIIAGLGAAFPSSTTSDRDIALAAEDDLGKVLWTNIGLDAGYMFAGGTLMAASAFGAEPAIEWRSHGAGVVTQGAGLLALDLLAVWDSGPREEALQALPAKAVTASSP
jgi:hypothetical protein